MSRKLMPGQLAALTLGRSARPSESAEDYPVIVARLNDGWRVIVCPDVIQWILQKRVQRKEKLEWVGSSFSTARDPLLRCIRARAGACDAVALELITLLPVWIHDLRGEYLTQMAPKPVLGPMEAVTSAPGGPTLHGSPTGAVCMVPL